MCVQGQGEGTRWACVFKGRVKAQGGLVCSRVG